MLPSPSNESVQKFIERLFLQPICTMRNANLFLEKTSVEAMNQEKVPLPKKKTFVFGDDKQFERGATGHRIITVNGKSRLVYMHGDMIMSKQSLMREQQLMSAPSRSKRWAYRDSFYPETIWQDGVPYEFDNSLSENPGCFSTVGRDTSQPEQPVNIGRGCQHFGITSHEIAHALGLFHHQQRYDRDRYITFNEENVAFKYWMNFAKIPSKYLDTYDLPYDIGSVMHYTPTEFSENEYLPALSPINPDYVGTMGSMDGPSFLDVQIINRHYQCYDACNTTENQPRCLNGGYVNPRNCSVCKCPTGFGGDVCQLIASSAPIRCGGLIPTTSSLTRMRIRLTSAGARRKCVYHIRAPPNRRVMIGLKSVEGRCQEGCYTTAVEMKMEGDFRPVGYRWSQLH
ncbi:unnamed protein product [Haemonchus placei]|uniref:Zinc metalloproteinase n=1 Tax=Haemonchus placei TaxID=6290 RepID=A0A158QP74_HAEPC|nr:unnamed protein product [Haemonchus placei]